MASEWWMVTLPNERGGADPTFRKLEATSAQPGYAAVFKLDPPQLKIGTLDSLMVGDDRVCVLLFPSWVRVSFIW